MFRVLPVLALTLSSLLKSPASVLPAGLPAACRLSVVAAFAALARGDSARRKRARRRSSDLTKQDPLIHRSVVGSINGLTEFLQVERKRVPDQVLWDAQRLECLLFSGYDPYFEGDEPPGL